jgi:hypothetical protein
MGIKIGAPAPDVVGGPRHFQRRAFCYAMSDRKSQFIAICYRLGARDEPEPSLLPHNRLLGSKEIISVSNEFPPGSICG